MSGNMGCKSTRIVATHAATHSCNLYQKNQLQLMLQLIFLVVATWDATLPEKLVATHVASDI
jgi:hypothetical protein